MGLFNSFLPIKIETPLDRIAKEQKKEIKKEIRKKVDEVISPYSDLGEVIHKVRKFTDQEEEKMENREKAPRNISYIGTKKENFQMADHLFVRVGPITHHAIYIGGSEVIHYSPDDKGNIKIHRVSLEKFADGREVRCLSESESPLKYTPQEAVLRAYHRVEEQNYDLFGNNCESFVRWCRNGGEESVWVDD